MFEKVFDVIKTNLKNPKLYVFLLILIIVILLLFPYIDANFFYYKRVNDRVEILTKVSMVDMDKITDNTILMSEYKNILEEIEKQSNGSLGSVFIKETDKTVSLIKFITGGVLFWVFAFLCFFIKGFNGVGLRVLGFFLLIGLGYLFGRISMAMPTIMHPEINYIGFPLAIFVIAGLLVTKGNRSKKKET